MTSECEERRKRANARRKNRRDNNVARTIYDNEARVARNANVGPALPEEDIILDENSFDFDDPPTFDNIEEETNENILSPIDIQAKILDSKSTWSNRLQELQESAAYMIISKQELKEYESKWAYEIVSSPYSRVDDDKLKEIKRRNKHLQNKKLYWLRYTVYTSLLYNSIWEQYSNISLKELAQRSTRHDPPGSSDDAWENTMARDHLRKTIVHGGLDRDGLTLWYIARKGILNEHIVNVTNQCRKMALGVEHFSKKDIRHRDEEENNPQEGVLHLKAWIMRGSKDRTPVISQATLSKGHSYEATNNNVFCKVCMENPRLNISALAHALDPITYNKLRLVIRDHSKRSRRVYDNFYKACDEDIFAGYVVIFNGRVLCHRDVRDIRDGWAVLLCFGDFVGGELCLPDLGIKIQYQPGDIIFIRSFALKHFIDLWYGADRYGVTNMNHQEDFNFVHSDKTIYSDIKSKNKKKMIQRNNQDKKRLFSKIE